MTANRTVFRLSGDDVRDFLQGLVTNDVGKLSDGLVYAAMLTPQGKLRTDFFLVPAGDDVLLDAPSAQADDLERALTMYRLRSNVTIERTEISVARGLGAPSEGAFADPRDPEMGWRAYDGREDAGDIDWDAQRVAHLIPEMGIELSGETYILEAGFERLNGVDFRKGCYVGQEVTARMKHKTELKKGLARVEVSGTADAGTEIVAGGKAVGTLFTHAGGQGIAYLRFDRATGEMQAGDATVKLTDR